MSVVNRSCFGVISLHTHYELPYRHGDYCTPSPLTDRWLAGSLDARKCPRGGPHMHWESRLWRRGVGQP